jgi:hypothetical protein
MNPAVATEHAALSAVASRKLYSAFNSLFAGCQTKTASWRPFPSSTVTLGKLNHTLHILYEEM